MQISFEKFQFTDFINKISVLLWKIKSSEVTEFLQQLIRSPFLNQKEKLHSTQASFSLLPQKTVQLNHLYLYRITKKSIKNTKLTDSNNLIILQNAEKQFIILKMCNGKKKQSREKNTHTRNEKHETDHQLPGGLFCLKSKNYQTIEA